MPLQSTSNYLSAAINQWWNQKGILNPYPHNYRQEFPMHTSSVKSMQVAPSTHLKGKQVVTQSMLLMPCCTPGSWGSHSLPKHDMHQSHYKNQSLSPIARASWLCYRNSGSLNKTVSMSCPVLGPTTWQRMSEISSNSRYISSHVIMRRYVSWSSHDSVGSSVACFTWNVGHH